MRKFFSCSNKSNEMNLYFTAFQDNIIFSHINIALDTKYNHVAMHYRKEPIQGYSVNPKFLFPFCCYFQRKKVMYLLIIFSFVNNIKKF